MSKILPFRFRVILLAGLLSLTSATATPTFAQEAEAETEETESVLVESTIVGDVDPSQATTVSDLTIPSDQLSVLVKPLTLEELQIEAAAWFLLLKNKAAEISQVELAIKRQNALIAQEEEAAALVNEAKTKLAEAEAALAAAKEGTPEYDEAAKQVEEGKEALLEANKSVEKLLESKSELKTDDGLSEAVEEAEAKDAVAQAQQVLDAAKEEREDLEADSKEYAAVTAEIDRLNQSLLDLEKAKEDLEGAIPGTPEETELKEQVEQFRTTVTEAADAIVALGFAAAVTPEDTLATPAETDAALEDITETVEETQEQTTTDTNTEEAEATTEDTPAAATENAEPPEDVDVGEAAEQLEGVDETLAQVAEAEADLKNQLVVNVTELQGEQTALIDRFQVVLNALDAKGGDSTSYRKYIEAINAIELDITDTEGLGVRLMTWLQSEEGGLRLGLSIGKFLGILLLAIALAPLIGMTVDKSLSRLNNALLRQFMVGLVKRGTVIVGFLLAVTSLGVSLGPLLALVGGVSFVLAFALQSNIGNFASGVMLMLYKPFDVGDRVLIPGTGLEASVREITLANTSFEHYSGKIITVPNATVWGSNIENIIPGEDRLLEYLFMIGSDADARAMKTVWDEVIENHPAINKDKWYMSMPYLSASSGSLMYWCGAFTSKQGYWTVYEEVLMGLWDGLKAAGVSFGINKEESYIRLVNGTFTENGFKLNNNGEHSEGTTVTAAAKPALVGSRKAPDLIDVDKDGLDNPDFD